MDKLEINDQFAVILFEDKTGGAWCKKVTGAEARGDRYMDAQP